MTASEVAALRWVGCAAGAMRAAPDDSGTLNPDLVANHARIAVPGGAIVDVPLGNDLLRSTVTEVTNTGVHFTLGAIVGIEVPLPAGVGDEVVFDFRTGVSDSSCAGLALLGASYQLDDLRVE
jgi:hypothetical protein